MNPIQKRRNNDLKKLKNLEKKYHYISVAKTEGNPISKIYLKLNLQLPISPKKNRNDFDILIHLSGEYPLKPPIFEIQPPVFNPHVFDSGKICMGDFWNVANTLDMEIERLLKILLLYPEFINTHSPANSKALDWYKRNSHLFPLKTL